LEEFLVELEEKCGEIVAAMAEDEESRIKAMKAVNAIFERYVSSFNL
jgi:hypothetical protein